MNLKTPKIKSSDLPKMSQYKSRAEWEFAVWHKVSKSKELLDLLLTAYERHNLVMRAAALDSLRAHKSYKQIGEELWLSPQTISSLKKAIRDKKYKSYLERGKTERKKREYSPRPKRGVRKPSGRPVRTKYGTIYMPY